MAKKIIEQVVVIFNQDEDGVYGSFIDGGGSLPARAMEQLCIGISNAVDKLNEIKQLK